MRVLIPNVGGTSFKYRLLEVDVGAASVASMMKKLGLGPDEMAVLLGSQPGLKGTSGTSGDVRDPEDAAAKGEKRAPGARRVCWLDSPLCRRIAALDVITFSGGIGESSAGIRAAVLKGMTALGVELDEDANQAAKGACGISALGSVVKVPVIPANEESIVARETAAVVKKQWSENGYGERNKFGFL